jgi:predicted MFS family arabinose efflux permease
MAIDAAAALAIGKMYDILNKRRGTRDTGLKLLIIIPILTLAIPLLVFSKDVRLVIAGVLSWGIVMGIHETIMRSAIADLTSLSRRGMGYGIFNTAYGLAMFAGSALLGFLYDRSLVLVIVAVIVTECLALIPFFLMQRNKRHREDLLT